MDFKQYQELAGRTAPERGHNNFFRRPFTHLDGPTPADTVMLNRHADHVDIIHASLGIGGEAGELVDSVKKSMCYGRPLDIENLKEEAGDLLWYISLLCRALNCTMEDLAIGNITKLYRRYPEKYTDAEAIARADKQLACPGGSEGAQGCLGPAADGVCPIMRGTCRFFDHASV